MKKVFVFTLITLEFVFFYSCSKEETVQQALPIQSSPEFKDFVGYSDFDAVLDTSVVNLEKAVTTYPVSSSCTYSMSGTRLSTDNGVARLSPGKYYRSLGYLHENVTKLRFFAKKTDRKLKLTIRAVREDQNLSCWTGCTYYSVLPPKCIVLDVSTSDKTVTGYVGPYLLAKNGTNWKCTVYYEIIVHDNPNNAYVTWGFAQ